MLRLNASRKKQFERIYVNLFGHQAYQRFALVGHARTGSTYLLSGLKASPRIKMYHEVFGPHSREKGKDFAAIFTNLFPKEKRAIAAVGFKLFYYHLTEAEWDEFLAYKDIKIIHLTRRNRLRTIVSREIAAKTDLWFASNSAEAIETPEKRISLDASGLLARIEQIASLEALARDRFKDWQILEVVYEDLVANPDRGFEEIGEFLGVDDIRASRIGLKKQNPESLQDLIVNYDRVSQVLQDTPFAKYLED